MLLEPYTLVLLFKRLSIVFTNSQHISSSSLPLIPKNIPVLFSYLTYSFLLTTMILGQLLLLDQNRILQQKTPLVSRVLLLKTDIMECLMFHVSLSPPNNDEILLVCMFEDKQQDKGT